MQSHMRIRATLITLLVTTLSLFSAPIGESVVLRLVGYIPERTTFTATEDGFFLVESNAHTFTYTVEESPTTRTLLVVAR
ncbi:MAG: hypothetical protein M0Q37_10455 [Sphaerochaeta sp.]|jgi:hypothetical protein|nr:hypothetical protein [Sphaerochaeta sp.]